MKTKLKMCMKTMCVTAGLAETKEPAFQDHQVITSVNVLTDTGKDNHFRPDRYKICQLYRTHNILIKLFISGVPLRASSSSHNEQEPKL